MGKGSARILLPLLLCALLMLSMIQMPSDNMPESDLDEEISTADSARQGGVEAQCQGLTFEDMFNYTHMMFDLVIDDTWETGFVRGVAYINYTLADQVRSDFDALFEPLGSDNGWLSTDEYSAVEVIAAECVSQTNPRIGFRSGPPHRGGAGVNWFNATWLDDDDHPMQLEEENLMPMNHADERSCQSSPNQDCVEIPVVPLTGRNCDTTRNDPDECRLTIWLNATLQFDGLLSEEEFIVAMNSTNMSHATLSITYPATEGLRVSLFEECDGRMVDEDPNNDGAAPTPGGCTSDGSIEQSSRLVNIDTQTRLRVDLDIHYDHDDWPTGQDFFIDMTTTPPEQDNAPTWNTDAPANGTILPVADDGVSAFLSAGQMAMWASDDHDSPVISCTGGDGWSMSSDADGMSADAPDGSDSTSITCKAEDIAGQFSDERVWTLQVPMRLSGAVSNNSAEVTLTPTAGMPEMTAVITLRQDDGEVSSPATTVSGQTSVTVDIAGLSPGPFSVVVAASGAGMRDFSHSYELSLSKDTQPPVINVQAGEWTDDLLELNGQFSDPDGDSVTISATISGYSWGTVSITGNQWAITGSEVPGVTTHLVQVEACDQWGGCTTVAHDAGMPPEEEEEQPTIPGPGKDEGGGLPGFGIFAALGAIALAGVAIRRPD